MKKIVFTGRRLGLVQSMFTDKWAKRSGAKLSSNKDALTITAEASVIDLIVKQKTVYCKHQGIAFEVSDAK